MPTLEVSTLLGQPLGDGGLRVTSVMVVLNNSVVVVGTNEGCVLAFSQPSTNEELINSAAVCVYAQALHHGPVYCLCASTSHFVASAGRDATPVVQPVFNLLKNGMERVCRFSGHTLPVSAIAFFSTGSWLATCGVGGRLIVFDTTTRSSLCDVTVGFSVRCLALSPDETTCFLGGTQLVRVDLYNDDRPIEPMTRRDPPLWLQRYSWSSNGEEFVTESPEDLFISQLHVTTDRLTAFFRCRRSNETGGAVATWSHGAADFWLSRDFHLVEDKLRMEDEGDKLRCPLFREIVFEETGENVEPVLRAHDGWDTWRRARVRVMGGPRLLAAAGGVGDCSADDLSAAPAGDTPADRLAYEEERGRTLQAECDELVRLLKARMNRGGKKRMRSSSAV